MTFTEFPPIKRQPLVDQVLDTLRKQVANGTYPVGSKLPPEPDLMARLAVGRSTIREAMRVLAYMGLVEVRAGDGTYVRLPPPEAEPLGQRLLRAQVFEVYEVRRALELECVRLAAFHRTDDDLAILQKTLAVRRSALAPGNEDTLINADLTFHLAVADATKNSVLADLYHTFVRVHRDSWFQAGRVPGLTQQGQGLHEQIADAIARRDPIDAQRLTHQLLDASTSRFQELLSTESQQALSYTERTRSQLMKMSGQQSSTPARGMQKAPITKYRPAPRVELPDREWPNRAITIAPTWCSVDLRDGNQALPTPMGIPEKLELYKTLVAVGFKEIEVGFPSASQTEFDFIRRLIDEDLIPDDVTIQVITQAREELIKRTIESVRGAKNVIIHLYNSTNEPQRRLVFGLDRASIIKIATDGTRLVKELVPTLTGTNVVFQYSPESFALTEMDFALEICEAVVDVWQPTPERKMILNLPETVEVSTPNVHADQMEWIRRNLRHPESIILSLHTHNDRGTGVAAAELGLLAGATRVEGTLFGNGERTGNVDIITLALNMYMQGVDPQLDFSNLDEIRVVYERCTRMTVPARWPYGGELVFTAFSGSHQDAIRKGMAAQDPTPGAYWEVPYLPIDPQDIGRNYEAIIRINSQSGKGGVAYILESEFGLHLPKEMHVEFGKVIKRIADQQGEELSTNQIRGAFDQEYLDREGAYEIENFFIEKSKAPIIICTARVKVDGVTREIQGEGNGPIDAFVQALNRGDIASFKIRSYAQHSLSEGSDAQAAAYIQIEMSDRHTFFGAAIETNTELAAMKAIVSALNRSVAS